MNRVTIAHIVRLRTGMLRHGGSSDNPVDHSDRGISKDRATGIETRFLKQGPEGTPSGSGLSGLREQDRQGDLGGKHAPGIVATEGHDRQAVRSPELLFRFSWKWRKRSPIKIMERTHEEATEVAFAGRESGHPEAAFAGQGADFEALR